MRTKNLYLMIFLCTGLLFSACQKEDISNRDPDPDMDGVCDPWVTKKGLSSEFTLICQGVDNCPNESGDGEDGCPKPQEEPHQEEKQPNKSPDPDGDGICSPWVVEEGLGREYADICKSYDICPDKAGAIANKGCPWDDPDVDNDNICDSWVIEGRYCNFFEDAASDQQKAKEWYITKFCKCQS